MTPFQALLLGIVQGATEFIPISSTAHLRLVPALCGWPEPGAAFSAVIQWGTFVASVIYFRKDIVRLVVAFLVGLRTGKPLGTQDARLAWMIATGTIPIVACGLLLQKQIKGSFRSLWVIALVMIGLAVVLMAAEWWARRRQRQGITGKEMDRIGWAEALLVGFAQALALVPGASRSGVTITGGLFAGLSRATAARYSFLLSLPSVFGAGLYQLYKEREELLATQESVVNLILATLVSGVVGYASIAFLLGYLRTRTTAIFILYRIVLGVLLLVLLWQKVIEP